MQAKPFKAEGLVDYLFDFSKGVNNGIDYALLPKDQLSSGINTTVRGSFVGPRPAFRKIELTAAGYDYGAGLSVLVSGRYQGGCYFKPDSGTESLMAAIGGHLYRFAIIGDTATVSDVSIPGDLNDPDQTRNWLWQAEKWIINTDGTNKPPLFYDGTSTVRSNYGTPITYTANNTAQFTVPAIGTEVTVPGAVPFDSVIALEVGDVITYRFIGSFTVQDIAGLNVTLLNISASSLGRVVPASTDNPISWVKTGTQLPPGRMGVYGLGRVWMSLVDGKQFVAGDIVGGSSGTVANNFRDAVLQITENLFLSGGGNFAVPGSYGDIRAMCFSETLDSSLGQGALQVFTPMTVFSCNAPVDRAIWQDVTNPILTESAKGGGGLGQWSTINLNSDILSRAYDGIRSLILTRREFNTWGNVPVSREVQPQMDRDSETLLGFTSSVAFDNRFLHTTEGKIVEDRGVVWTRLAVINNDPVSSLQGKAPSLYDALYWQGLNVFQLIRGEFSERERCFAFTYNEHTEEIELYEILRSADPIIYDNDETRIVWTFESPMLDFGQRDPRLRQRLRLGQCQISVNELRGKVSFQSYFKPDYWPCWVPWASWEECSDNELVTLTSPSFRPRMVLAEPDARWCDPTNNRPLREGYYFHFKLVVTGYCKVTAIKFTADTVPETAMGPCVCNSICPT
jgi:hypothetical protein